MEKCSYSDLEEKLYYKTFKLLIVIMCLLILWYYMNDIYKNGVFVFTGYDRDDGAYTRIISGTHYFKIKEQNVLSRK